MADIRVERKTTGNKTWLWVLLAVVVLVIAVLLLDYFGYIRLPVRLWAVELSNPPAELRPAVAALTMEA